MDRVEVWGESECGWSVNGWSWVGPQLYERHILPRPSTFFFWLGESLEPFISCNTAYSPVFQSSFMYLKKNVQLHPLMWHKQRQHPSSTTHPPNLSPPSPTHSKYFIVLLDTSKLCSFVTRNEKVEVLLIWELPCAGPDRLQSLIRVKTVIRALRAESIISSTTVANWMGKNGR